MSPETSTKENPMKEYRNNSSRCDGFLPIEITNEPQVRPTPIATPMKAEEAIAPAINLKPMVTTASIKEKHSKTRREPIVKYNHS